MIDPSLTAIFSPFVLSCALNPSVKTPSLCACSLNRSSRVHNQACAASRIPFLRFIIGKPQIYSRSALSKLQDSAQKDAAAVMRGTRLAQDILTQVDVIDRWMPFTFANEFQ